MKNFFVHFRVQLLISLFLLLVLGLALLFPFYLSTPSLPSEALPTTAIYDRQGQWLTYLPQADYYRQEPLPTNEPIPPMVQRALLASEDKRFLSHIGVDFLAVGRALYQNMTGSARRSGASTITMQLAKMSLAASDRGLGTKLHEALLARRLEMSYSKEELLRAYLNHADFGNLCRGIQTASRHYFNKDARDLNAPEAALLIAQLQSPTRYNPFRYPERALAARNRILKLLGEDCSHPLGLQRPVDNLPPHLKKYPGRLAIDPILQNYAYDVVQQEVSALSSRNVQQAALIVVRNETGEVLASIASANPLDPRGGQLDGTRVRRSAGSTLKPFVYLLALRAGENPSSIYADVPTSFPDSSGIDAPSNFNNLFLGPITMRTALASSQNIPALLALNNHGGEAALLALLTDMGYEIEEDIYGLGLAIGNAHVSLREQAAAFSTLARGGKVLPLRDYLDDARSEIKPRDLLDPRYVYQLSNMLSDNDARVPGMGRADSLRFRFPCAVKTGTSSDFRDNWCVGYSPLYTVAVWVGNFDQSPMRDVSGLDGAGPIFQRVMRFLHEDEILTPFARPDGLQERSVDKRTGKLAHSPEKYLATEWMTEEQIPTPANPTDYDEEGRALLPVEFIDWYEAQGDLVKNMYSIDYDRDLNRAPRVLMPADGTVITLVGNEDEEMLIPLRSTINPHHARWFCRSMRLEQRGDEWFALARKGEHTIFVEDRQSQRRSHCRIFIK